MPPHAKAFTDTPLPSPCESLRPARSVEIPYPQKTCPASVRTCQTNPGRHRGNRPTPEARGQTPDARRPTPDARRPTPDARRRTPEARRPRPDAGRPRPDARGQTPDARGQTARRPTPDARAGKAPSVLLSVRDLLSGQVPSYRRTVHRRTDAPSPWVAGGARSRAVRVPSPRAASPRPCPRGPGPTDQLSTDVPTHPPTTPLFVPFVPFVVTLPSPPRALDAVPPARCAIVPGNNHPETPTPGAGAACRQDPQR